MLSSTSSFFGQHRIIPLSAIGLVILTGWAAVAEIDQISRAGGQVIPAGRVQIIQSTDGGVIKEILVREGQTVRQGQPLITLDQIKIAAAVREGEAKVAGFKSQKSRIEAELFNRPLSFPPELKSWPEFVENERELYARRTAAQAADIAALKRMLVLVRRELEMNKSLVEFGDVSQAEILRLERSLVEIEGQIASKQGKYLSDLQTQYTQIDQELASAEQLLTQRRASFKESVLKSPTDGTVKNIRLTTLGGVLRPGDEALEIVPSRGKPIVEVKVSPKDIAYVRVGQMADVKFDAYDSSIYGSAVGRVTYVSPDTLVERREAGATSDAVYYRVHVMTDTKTMHARPGEKITIQPGMTGIAEIKTGKNTVLNFLLKPITKTIGNSFGER
jgi:membrane fusion protein, adhesin transport system